MRNFYLLVGLIVVGLFMMFVWWRGARTDIPQQGGELICAEGYNHPMCGLHVPHT